MAKVKSCVILNPPKTSQEQEDYDKSVAKALALGLYRTLGHEKAEKLLESCKKDVQETQHVV